MPPRFRKRRDAHSRSDSILNTVVFVTIILAAAACSHFVLRSYAQEDVSSHLADWTSHWVQALRNRNQSNRSSGAELSFEFLEPGSVERTVVQSSSARFVSHNETTKLSDVSFAILDEEPQRPVKTNRMLNQSSIAIASREDFSNEEVRTTADVPSEASITADRVELGPRQAKATAAASKPQSSAVTAYFISAANENKTDLLSTLTVTRAQEHDDLFDGRGPNDRTWRSVTLTPEDWYVDFGCEAMHHLIANNFERLLTTALFQAGIYSHSKNGQSNFLEYPHGRV